MISKLNLENILFLDIETVPEVPYFSDLDETKQALWEHKSQYQRKDDETAEAFYERAGIWAEFGKIICISVGYFIFRGDIRNFRVTSFYGDEIKILKDFKNLLNSHFSETKHLLCAHNGKEFDFPYIARRMIINNIELPYKLNLFGKKPWEVPHLETPYYFDQRGEVGRKAIHDEDKQTHSSQKPAAGSGQKVEHAFNGDAFSQIVDRLDVIMSEITLGRLEKAKSK